MSIYDFIKLSLEERAELVLERGVFLDSFASGVNATSLYLLDGFFVEAEICVKEARITDFIPFKQGYRLEKYVEDVDLTQILFK
jgi:hypothetical protein